MNENQDPLETILMVVVGVVAAPFVLAGVGAYLSTDVRSWLIEHEILVPAYEAVWAIPGMDAGLDLGRIALFVAVLLLVFCIVWFVRSMARKTN